MNKKLIFTVVIKLIILVAIVAVSAVFLNFKFDVEHGNNFMLFGKNASIREGSHLERFMYLGLDDDTMVEEQTDDSAVD